MKILFIGDIFGRSGREALQKHLPHLQAQFEPDITIVNGENAAHGKGITPKMCTAFYEWGVDVITTGNHVWDQREIIPYIANDPNLLRPVNYPADTPGQGMVKFQTPAGQTIMVINAMGRLFMDPLDDPFNSVKKIASAERLGKTVDAIFVDFHADATSEKMALAHYLGGQVSAVIGTHTHLPTADHHIMQSGTAFMGDAGMTGDYNSVIGVDKSVPIDKFVRKMPGAKFEPAGGEATLCGVVIKTNDNTGLAVHIEPIRIGGILTPTLNGGSLKS